MAVPVSSVEGLFSDYYLFTKQKLSWNGITMRLTTVMDPWTGKVGP